MEKRSQTRASEQQAVHLEKGDILNAIRFKTGINPKTGEPIFESSEPGRKLIRIEPSGYLDGKPPIPGQSYRVEIVEDSIPNNPEKGVLTVKLLPGNVDEEKWASMESKYKENVGFEVKRRIADRELYEETGIPSAQRKGIERTTEYHEDADKKSSGPIQWPRIKTVEENKGQPMTPEELVEASDQDPLDILVTELVRTEQKSADNVLGLRRGIDRRGGAEISPLTEQLETLMRHNITEALRGERDVQKKLEDINTKIARLEQSNANKTPSPTAVKLLRQLQSAKSELLSDRKKAFEASPEAFFALHLKELRQYKRNLEEGRLVETAYVQQQKEKVTQQLEAGNAVFLYGHLGAGKTELALKAAEEYSSMFVSSKERAQAKAADRTIDKTPIVISGSKKMGQSELYGHQVLLTDALKEKELADFAEMVASKYEAWVAEHEDATDQEKQLAHDRYLQTYLSKFSSGTFSQFLLGPVYKAMEEGRCLIIDEVNEIPHEVLVSLNHALTRKVGDKMSVQQDAGQEIEVKKGYGVIMTGNLNVGQANMYQRQDLDPAFLSRLKKIEHDYLPQETTGKLASVKLHPDKHQQFLLMISRVMDRSGAINLPDGAIEKLLQLAQAARVIQDVFSGVEVGEKYAFKQGGSRTIAMPLRESVLSLRAIDRILNQWQVEGYRNELDYYIAEQFLSDVTNPMEKAYLYQLLKDQFDFFKGDGWEKNPEYGGGSGLAKFDIPIPQNDANRPKFMDPLAVIRMLYGEEPARKEWPEGYVEESEIEAESTTRKRTRRRKKTRRESKPGEQQSETIQQSFLRRIEEASKVSLPEYETEKFTDLRDRIRTRYKELFELLLSNSEENKEKIDELMKLLNASQKALGSLTMLKGKSTGLDRQVVMRNCLMVDPNHEIKVTDELDQLARARALSKIGFRKDNLLKAIEGGRKIEYQLGDEDLLYQLYLELLESNDVDRLNQFVHSPAESYDGMPASKREIKKLNAEIVQLQNMIKDGNDRGVNVDIHVTMLEQKKERLNELNQREERKAFFRQSSDNNAVKFREGDMEILKEMRKEEAERKAYLLDARQSGKDIKYLPGDEELVDQINQELVSSSASSSPSDIDTINSFELADDDIPF